MRDGDLFECWPKVWSRAVFAVAASGLLTLTAACREAGEPVAVRLDLHPFSDPSATFVRVRVDGAATAIRYSASALAVDAVHEGHLPRARIERLLAPAEGSELRRAISSSWRESSGIEHGDVYELWVELSDGTTRRAGGFRHDAPAGVDGWIDDLLSLAGILPEVVGAEAYLRVVPLRPGQLESIRRRGLLELGGIEDVPAELRKSTRDPSRTAGEFHSISRQQYGELAARANHGGELLIDSGGEGLRLSPFKVRKRSALSDDRSQ